jgi:hypothetical protein
MRSLLQAQTRGRVKRRSQILALSAGRVNEPSLADADTSFDCKDATTATFLNGRELALTLE